MLALSMAKKARRAGFGAAVVFGGPHASVAPDHLKSQPCVDALLIGEAEESFPQYLRHLEGKSHELQRTWVRNRKGKGTLRAECAA
jgi:radical SAM superfamily enzyme YgiQ (UPF0313 family)